ncbi:MAG: flagellar filament capping protein FliD [Victivallales bacterium]|nr:flagellar filament capping protein FliD [Victivallales bacterium]
MTLRISGLASGLDTESIIKALIEARKVPITTLEEKVEENNELYEIWSEVDLGTSNLSASLTSLNSFTTWSEKTFSSTFSTVVTGNVTGAIASNGTYTVSVSQLADEANMNGSVQASAKDVLNYSGSFSIAGNDGTAEITVETGDSLQDIMNKINDSKEDTGVESRIIGTTLVIESSSSGADKSFTITSTSGTALADLGFTDGATATGKDLLATVDSIPVTSSKNDSVSTLISGVTLNFTDTGTSKITIEQDTESTIAAIESFITAYNELMEYLAEQTAISDINDPDQIGPLQGDRLASQIPTQSRAILTQSIEKNETIKTLYDCGIWTDGKENEIKIVDMDKLQDALENNFQEVSTLFRGYGSSSDQRDNDGVTRQLSEYVAYLQKIEVGGLTVKMSGIVDDTIRLEDKIEKMNKDLETYEVSLWRHYASMEESVSTIQRSSQYLLNALGMNNKDD